MSKFRFLDEQQLKNLKDRDLNFTETSLIEIAYQLKRLADGK